MYDQNISLVYCRYWIVIKSIVSSVGSLTDKPFLSDEGPTLETLDFTYPYRQYTNLFTSVSSVSEHCLRSTLRLFH